MREDLGVGLQLDHLPSEALQHVGVGGGFALGLAANAMSALREFMFAEVYLGDTARAEHAKIEKEVERTHGKEKMKEVLKVEGLLELDEKQRQVSLTETGNEHMSQLLKAAGILESGDLYDTENITTVHHVNQALRARFPVPWIADFRDPWIGLSFFPREPRSASPSAMAAKPA